MKIKTLKMIITHKEIRRNDIFMSALKNIPSIALIKVDKIKNGRYTKFVNEKYVTVRSRISFDLCLFFLLICICGVEG